MKKSILVIVLLFSMLWSFKTEKKNNEEHKYLRWVGDIEQNDQIDKLDFNSCNGDDNILQYFNLGKGPVYIGEKLKILNIFKSKYQPISDDNQNGLVRIRFVVNCKGKAGRFRVLQSDNDYQKTEFNQTITSQILSITKQINNWKILYKEGNSVDYYMYLIFKIKEGYIIEILP